MSRRGPSCTLYVRNVSERARYDDLRRLFQKYGRVVDVTIPLDYYSRMPKSFCFVEYEDPRDAEEALHRLDRQRLFGRELEVEFARGERKSASEMRTRIRDRRHDSGRDYRDRDGRHERSRRSRTRSRSRTPIKRHKRSSRDKSRSRSRSKSINGNDDRNGVSRSRSHSKDNGKSPSRERSRSQSRDKSVSKSPERRNDESRSPSRSRTRSRSRSQSPID